jgi:hypothetical protein
MHVSAVNWQSCCSAPSCGRSRTEERGRRKIGIRCVAAKLASGAGDGPTPSCWLAEVCCWTQVVASPLQPSTTQLHRKHPHPVDLPCQSQQTPVVPKTTEPSSACSPRRPRCCHATRRVGTDMAVRTPDLSCLRQPTARSILSLHFGPKRLMAQMVRLLDNAHRPRIVKSHPFPIALMAGAATTAPAHENMLRTKLLTATPFDDCLGINSVSMVIAMAKMSIDPSP